MLAPVLNVQYPKQSPAVRRHSCHPPPFKAPLKSVGDTERVVSIIHRDNVTTPIVTKHVLDHDTGCPQVLPGAPSYRFLTSLSESAIDDKRISKVVRKGTASLGKLYALLGGASENTTTWDCTRNSRQISAKWPPMVTIGQGAFMSTTPLPSKRNGSDAAEIYTSLQLQFSNGLTSTQYFNARCSGIKPAFLNQAIATKFERIHIISGICLFSKPVLTMSPGGGQPNVDEKPVIPPLPWNVDLTLYELETAARLSSAIADTACVVRGSSRGRNTPLSINIDIPDFQYYWTACELLERSLVTVDYVQGWIAAIDERRRKLKAIMTSLLRRTLTDRQLSDIEINITSGTEPAVNLIKEKVVFGTIPSLEEIMGAVRSQGGEARQWRDFLNHLDSGQQPSTVGDLGRLVYVFKAVKPVLEHGNTAATPSGNTQDAPGRTLIIQVDDITEWRIFDRAKSFLERYFTQKPTYTEKSLIVGLFPIQKTFVAGPNRSDLYHTDPGPQLCLNPEGAIIGPLDVIGMTYGWHMKERLRRLSRREAFL